MIILASDNCEMCSNYVFDEDSESYVCLVDMDEDDYMRYITSKQNECPYFRLDDEYAVVRKQN